MPDQHRANRMDRLMPIQTFSLEAVQRVLGEVKPLGELALDDDVNGHVEVGLWKLRAHPAVICGDKVEPLGFFKRKPLLRVRRRCGIIFHRALCFMSCHERVALTLQHENAGGGNLGAHPSSAGSLHEAGCEPSSVASIEATGTQLVGDRIRMFKAASHYTPSMIRRPAKVSRIWTSRRLRSLSRRSAAR